jgi:hypothetical protein
MEGKPKNVSSSLSFLLWRGDHVLLCMLSTLTTFQATRVVISVLISNVLIVIVYTYNNLYHSTLCSLTYEVIKLTKN